MGKKRTLQEALIEAGNEVLGQQEVVPDKTKMSEEELLATFDTEKKKPTQSPISELPNYVQPLPEKEEPLEQPLSTNYKPSGSISTVPSFEEWKNLPENQWNDRSSLEDKVAYENFLAGIGQPKEEKKENVSQLKSAERSFTRRIAELPAALEEGIVLLGRGIDNYYYGLHKQAFPMQHKWGEENTHPLTDALLDHTRQYRAWLDEVGVKDGDPSHPLTNSVATATADLATLIATGGISTEAKALATLGEISTTRAILAKSGEMAVKQMTSPVSLVAGTKIASDEYNQAISSGATEDQATDVALKNWAVGGGLEAIPVAQFFKRLNTATGGGFKNWLKNTATTGVTQGGEEAITEIMQQAYSNYTASQTYDATRSIFDGMKESGGVGFGIGFVLGAMGVSLRRRQEIAQTPEEKAEIQKAIDFVDQKTSDLESGKLTDQGQEIITEQEITPTQETITTQPTEEIVTQESTPETISSTITEPQIEQENDSQIEQRIPSEVGVGKELVTTESFQEPSPETTETSGVLQTPPETTIEGEVQEQQSITSKFQESVELYQEIKNAEGANKKRSLKDKRNKFLENNPKIKYIDDNMKSIYKQLEEKKLLTKRGDCP